MSLVCLDFLTIQWDVEVHSSSFLRSKCPCFQAVMRLGLLDSVSSLISWIAGSWCRLILFLLPSTRQSSTWIQESLSSWDSAVNSKTPAPLPILSPFGDTEKARLPLSLTTQSLRRNNATGLFDDNLESRWKITNGSQTWEYATTIKRVEFWEEADRFRKPDFVSNCSSILRRSTCSITEANDVNDAMKDSYIGVHSDDVIER